MNIEIVQLPCWKRILLATLIIIGYPIVLAIYVAIWAVGIVLGAICGFFGGPVFFFTNFPCLQNGCCCTLCPLYMALGSVIGVGGAFGFGVYLWFKITC